MHTITVSTDTESRDYSVPENFAEMSGRQLIVACSILLGNTSEDAVEALTGIGNEILSAMSPFQMYNITQLFENWNSKTESICFKEWKIPEIKVGDTVYYGPTSNFGNITWGEFVYADQCMMQGYHKAVVAALFRQKRKGYDGETDIRIPFTTYGTSKRFKEMNELDEETMLAIILTTVPCGPPRLKPPTRRSSRITMPRRNRPTRICPTTHRPNRKKPHRSHSPGQTSTAISSATTSKTRTNTSSCPPTPCCTASTSSSKNQKRTKS